MTQAIKFVGLDVHVRQTTMAVLDKDTGEISRCKLRMEPAKVIEHLVGIEGDVRAVYEAGPTGLELARLGAERGVDVRVCAPGLIPRAPSDRVKTDARDAERLARQLAAGSLTFVRMPSPAEESLRDLVRAREDIRADLMRARHRLSKSLLRYGRRYSDGHGRNGLDHEDRLRPRPPPLGRGRLALPPLAECGRDPGARPARGARRGDRGGLSSRLTWFFGP